MIKKVFLALSKVLLVGWSLLYLLGQLWGLLYVSGNLRGLLRTELWINFAYGFGCLFSIYCIFSCFGLLRWKNLLVSGILMHILAILSIVWIYKYYYPEQLTTDIYSLSIFAFLWFLHFIAQFIYETKIKFT
jgi:hypothetical protein